MSDEQIRYIEQDNYDKIHLFSNGEFWWAYERSAYHLVKVYPSDMVKPMTMDAEMMDKIIVAFGLTFSTVEGMMNTYNVVSMTGCHITFEALLPFSELEFQHWKYNMLTLNKYNRKADPEMIKQSEARTLN